MALRFRCSQCGNIYNINTKKYNCECGGLFDLKGQISNIKINLSLGEGNTPFIERNIAGKNVFFKLDYLQPTGSFKDRGAVFLIDQLAKIGVKKIVEDSSGNAGAAIAAYAAASGIDCSIYLPADTSRGKIKQIKSYGAEIIKIKGDRDNTSEAVKESVENYYYASHVYNPLFFAGTASLAYELKKDIGIPDKIFVPVGNGTMLLGLYYGFKEIGSLPKLIAVQSENCSPIYQSYCNENYNLNEDSICIKTIAEGIAIGTPERKNQIIEAIRESKGDIIRVNETEITNTLKKVYKMGLYVEPTSAVAPAGFIKYINKNKVNKNDKIVIPLTGSGLKK